MQQITEATSKLEKAHGIKIPFPDPRPPKECSYKVSFAQPAQLNVVGSYVSKTMVESQADRAVDMILVIPEEVLQEKDYLNLRYFYKRAYYLSKVAVSLKQELGASIGNLSYEYLNGNPLLPVLAVAPKVVGGTKQGAEKPGKGADSMASPSGYRIRLIPCAPDGYFPTQKLSSASCLIRGGGDEDKKKSSAPTPFYNSTLKAESAFIPYLRLLRQAEKACPSFQDACILGRVFLQQRGLGGSVALGGFGHFEWAVLTALLLQTGGRKGQALLSASLNSTQLFKAMVQYLAETNFLKKPCILGPSKEQAEAIREAGPVVYDSARHLNIAFKMSSWSAALLHQHARWTHALLSDSHADHFTPTFITRVDHPAHIFDLTIKLRLREGFDQSAYESRGQGWTFSAKVYSTVKRALGNRARLVYIGNSQAASSWPLTGPPASPIDADILVGVIFDSAHVGRQVDHGPPAEDKKEAQKFQQFWGDKAELRRFKDGSILETLIWTSTSPAELCEEIIRYILGRHLRQEADVEDLSFYGKGLPSLLPVQPTDGPAFSAARQAFETFERDVRDLEDLPLHVRQLAPICPELRFASVTPPSFASTKYAPRPMDVIIFFEASGKWPDNLAAIQRAKIAFLLKIGSLLEEAKPHVTTHLGVEDARLDIENLAHLDIVYESGAAFRLRVHSDLEETLLDRRTKDKTLEQYVRAESASLLSAFRRLYTYLPLHTQTIRTYATRFPALSPTIRLLKSWFDGHKLSIHFAPDLIELFALHVFLTPYPWDAPSSATTGFLRALLFLARWDWRTEPLVIDTTSSTDPDDPTITAPPVAVDRAAVATRLAAWRKIDPAMNRTVLFVATNHDGGGSGTGTAHTSLAGEPTPPKVVATRMTTLARSATRLVRDRGAEIGLAPVARALFAPALGDYDVLIRLDRKALKACARTYAADPDSDGEEDGEGEGGARHHHRAPRFKNLDRRTGQVPLPQGTHPARLVVERLGLVVGGPLLFFHGAEDDAVVAAVWDPQARRRAFRPNLPCSYRPVAASGSGDDDDDEAVEVEVNREGILAEIARIGGDLIAEIEVKG